MTDKMYVIVASGGRYDDSWTRNEYVTSDKAKAEAAIKDLEAEHAKDLDTVKQLGELREAVNDEIGPAETESLLPYPRWAPGLGEDQITQKMRNERKKIELKNERIAKRNEAAWKARHKILEDREKTLLKSLGYPKGHYLYEYQYGLHTLDETSYDIEEVEVLA